MGSQKLRLTERRERSRGVHCFVPFGFRISPPTLDLRGGHFVGGLGWGVKSAGMLGTRGSPAAHCPI